MSVKDERCAQAHSAHDHKAGAIHQAQRSAPALEEHLDSRLMSGLIDPLDAQHGHNILLEHAQSLWAQPALNQDRRLNQDVIAAHEGRILLDQAYPYGFGSEMTQIVAIKHGEES